MQLRLSIVTCTLLLATASLAEDYISIQYMGYDEESGQTTVHSPHIEFNKEFGADNVLHLSIGYDSLSGASPTMYDSFSGASATLPAGTVFASDIRYGYIPYEDERTAYSAAWTTRFESRDELTLGVDYSSENDYTSRGISAEYLHYLDESKNQSISLGVSYQKNDIDIYCFMGNSECDTTSGASPKNITKTLDATSIEIGFTQIIDQTSLIKTSLFYANEDGYLSNPYMRIVRDGNKITQESKPNKREAYGLTLEYSKALSDALSMTLYCRYYDDDWDVTSHTLGVSLFYEVNEKLTVGFATRYYTQSAAYFYSPQKDYFTNEIYASSDRRMGEYDAYDYKLSADYKLTESTTLQGSVGYYEQPNHFDATYYSVGFKYAF